MLSRNKGTLASLLIIAILCISLVGLAELETIVEEQMPYKQFSLIEAQEPVIPHYPFGDNTSLIEKGEPLPSFQDWWAAKNDKQETINTYREKMQSFTKNSARFFLANESDSNMVYSPVNIWICLELLSGITESNSRKQVMNLLGLDPETQTIIDDEDLYKALYWDDGFSVCRPAASIWINQRTHFSDSLLSKLAYKYHTSVFQGPMGEDSFNEAFQTWMNKQTNGLLKEVVNNLCFDRETAISLSTSLYVQRSWSLPFNKLETYTGIFYSAEGETEADFMRKEEGGGTVYRGDVFLSIIMDLQDGGYVTLVLPDLGKSVEEVLESDVFFDFLFSGVEWSNVKKGRIKISMPKVDILAATPLKNMFTHMGVTDIFDSAKAMFSSEINCDDDLKLEPIEQYSRLIMNEDGVEAASMIVSSPISFQIPIEEEIDFILNRPFIFAVFSETNIPLFVGVYNTP